MGWSHFSVGFWANMAPTIKVRNVHMQMDNPLCETKQIHSIPISLNNFFENSDMNFKIKPYSENGAR
jgi:hypothetical protein